MRTGAVTAVGAKYLARKSSRVLGHIGARGTAYWNVRLLDHLFDFDEIRVHSRREDSRRGFAERLSQDLGKPVIATEDWQGCIDGADIVVEASRLNEPAPLLKTSWIKQGAFVVPYGTMSAIELSLTDIMTKLVVDDWGQCKGGKFGSLRRHVETGKLSEATLHAELGQIVAGLKRGRESEAETNLLWHRGLSLSTLRSATRCWSAERLGSAAAAASPEAGDGLYCQRAHVFSRSRRAAAWRDLFGWLAQESGIALDVIDHAFPLRLSELCRDAISPAPSCAGCRSCTRFSVPRRVPCESLAESLADCRADPARRPVPGRPVYATADRARGLVLTTLESTFGRCLGYTVEDSHSGYNALRHHLLPYRASHGGKLYRESIGRCSRRAA